MQYSSFQEFILKINFIRVTALFLSLHLFVSMFPACHNDASLVPGIWLILANPFSLINRRYGMIVNPFSLTLVCNL